MGSLRILLIAAVFSLASSKPTTESTHAILKRLGFDPVQRSPVNHHSKRVALETNKARYHDNTDYYNSNLDSRMFVVKLPPHSPYYSHMRPEKFKNELSASSSSSSLSSSSSSSSSSKHSANFHTNGKPGQIYHWNIPIIKRLTQVKRGAVRKGNEDSKVYRIKILPNQIPLKSYSSSRQESHKAKTKHKNKFEESGESPKSSKYHRNKLYRFSDSLVNGTSSNSNSTSGTHMYEPETSHSQPLHNITLADSRHGNYIYEEPNKSHSYLNKKFNDKYANEVSKVKGKIRSPNYYVPAIPKQNSFHKYFSGNGKPKSFYVIEKSQKPTKLHRLL